jgi:hypothetical protein
MKSPSAYSFRAVLDPAASVSQRCPGFFRGRRSRCACHRAPAAFSHVAETTMAKSVLDALYHTTRWRFARAAHLAKHPLCQRCESFGRVRAASLVDHNPPCGDSISAFWDPTRYRSLCAKCHAAVRAEQKRGYSTAVDVTGKPIDPRHLGLVERP